MKIIIKIAWFSIFAAILLFTPLVALKKTAFISDFPIKTETYKTILTVWHVDTFEGGVGSRADYLQSLCLNFPEEGVNALVSSYTVEGVKVKFSNGEVPDVLSFGIGVPFAVNYAREIENSSCKGGELLGKTYAVPWCRGGYFLISKTAINGTIDRLIISKSEYNNPLAASVFSKTDVRETETKEPLGAYTQYLKNGGVLLGTQRDIWRLTARGETFEVTPIEEFSDLYQYLAVTAKDEDKVDVAKRLVSFIVENAGKNIEKIGMFSLGENNYDGEMGKYVLKDTLFTVSPFTSQENLALIGEIANEKINSEDIEQKLKNIIKQL